MGSDVPVETQMLLLEAREDSDSDEDARYVVFLPVLDGEFRSSLQGNEANELEFCVESGKKLYFFLIFVSFKGRKRKEKVYGTMSWFWLWNFIDRRPSNSDHSIFTSGVCKFW